MRQIVAGADIYGITDHALSFRHDNVLDVRLMLEAGIRLVQYREKERKMGVMLEECRAIRQLTREAGATFIINDYPALALLVDADGVHVGQDDLPVPELRSLLGPDKIIGVSTHAPEQARKAVEDGADYIGVGPVFETKTKKDVCAPVGLEYLDYVVEHFEIPFVAIGGIKAHNLDQVVRHGAECCCIVSAIVGAESIVPEVERLRRIIDATRSENLKKDER